MPILFTELIFGAVNTISIPTDAIFMISVLIIFTLLVYFFNKIIYNETSKVGQKIDFDSNLKLEDNLTLEVKIPEEEEENVEKTRNKKLNLQPNSKFLGIGSLAFLAMGGVSLLGLQHMQKSYQGVNTSRTNTKLENQSTKSPLSIVHLKLLNKTEKTIKKINYIDPFLKTIQNSNANHFNQVKGKEIENNFSF